ncbi:MAG: (2Fe-2S)-binding protein [Myxococcales bacterium]|nr:(2Fe-2S)-binding protein [Myxococcales bacterium]
MSTVTCTIDGVSVTVEKGTTILEAARTVGIEVPHFCYHPALSIAANCRMCLVHVEKARNPLPACHATVADGMVVDTASEKTKHLQEAVLEFILVNHPVDCPVCDQAGECRLQDYYRDYSARPSRLDVPKVGKPKAKPLGPNVILDAERCILCTRCVRFTEEISKDFQLQTIGRGNHTEIDTFPGTEFDSAYSLNTVDICPVGALTSRDFRFKKRVWLLSRHETVCAGCARGCASFVDHADNTVYRYVPRYNPYVNDHWMCDAGRLRFHELQDHRLRSVMNRDAKGDAEPSVGETLERIAEALRLTENGRLGILLSPSLSNEDIYALRRFGKEAMGARFYVGGRAPGDADEILVMADKNANRLGLETLVSKAALKSLDALAKDLGSGAIDVLLIAGEHELSDAVIEAIDKAAHVVALTNLDAPWLRAVDRVLPTPQTFEYDGTYVSATGRVQRFERGVQPGPSVKPAWELVCKLAKLYGYADLDFASVRSIFKEISLGEAAFRGMNWKALRPFGAQLAGVAETMSPTIHARAGKH